MKTFAQRLLLVLVAAGMIVAPARRLSAQRAPSRASTSIAGEASTPEANSSVADEEEKDENESYKHSASVKKIGSLLGLTTEQAAMAFEVTNFVVLVIFLGLVIVKTLPKTFRKRNTDIQKHLVDARAATEEASLRLSGVEARLSKLDEQIAAMRSQADKDSALDEQRILAGVEEEKQKILAAAEQEIAAAAIHARRQIQQYAAELAIEQAARKLVISAETDRLLVQNFARSLGGDKGQN